VTLLRSKLTGFLWHSEGRLAKVRFALEISNMAIPLYRHRLSFFTVAPEISRGPSRAAITPVFPKAARLGSVIIRLQRGKSRFMFSRHSAGPSRSSVNRLSPRGSDIVIIPFLFCRVYAGVLRAEHVLICGLSSCVPDCEGKRIFQRR
jgi:hypothetical protein